MRARSGFASSNSQISFQIGFNPLSAETVNLGLVEGKGQVFVIEPAESAACTNAVPTGVV